MSNRRNVDYGAHWRAVDDLYDQQIIEETAACLAEQETKIAPRRKRVAPPNHTGFKRKKRRKYQSHIHDG